MTTMRVRKFHKTTNGKVEDNNDSVINADSKLDSETEGRDGKDDEGCDEKGDDDDEEEEGEPIVREVEEEDDDEEEEDEVEGSVFVTQSCQSGAEKRRVSTCTDSNNNQDEQ